MQSTIVEAKKSNDDNKGSREEEWSYWQTGIAVGDVLEAGFIVY